MKCTLEIKDEVNIRFNGVDTATRRKLGDELKYFLPQAYHMPSYKLGRWDGCVRFCDVGGRSYFNLLDRLIPILIADGYEIEIDDHRTPYTFDFKKVDQDTFKHLTWPKGHAVEGQPIVLRDYQIEIINRFIDNPQCLQQIATGAGKTLITAALSTICEPMGRTMVIVPNKDLVTQTEKDYINMGLDVGVLYGDRKEFGRTHTICTWQILASLEKNTKKYKNRLHLTQEEREQFISANECWCCGAAMDGKHEGGCLHISGTIDEIVSGVSCIMVDEVHKAKADVLKDQLSGMFKNVPVRWGLTGTIPEEEHEAVSCICALGPVVGQLSSKELQDMGVLSDIDISVVQLQDGVLGFSGYQQELKWLVTDETRLRHISEIVTSYAENNGNTLVLIDRLATGDILAEMNPDWVFLSGATKQKDRQREYDEINDVDGKVIVATYGIAAVGINVPRLFNLFMIEPGKSFVRVIQSIGRILRKASDKDYASVVDITSNLKYSKRHLTKRKKFYKDQGFPFKVIKVQYK